MSSKVESRALADVQVLPRPVARPMGAAILASLTRLVAAVRAELRMRRDVRQLMTMDPHLLRDIGVSRDEIRMLRQRYYL
jgi:uncharacterized protein YjiS (DUF1127 family)